MSLSLVQIGQIAEAERAAMAQAGELTGDHLWTALRGSAKYLKAILSGDVAPRSTADLRASRCQNCTSHTLRTVTVNGRALQVLHCGPAYLERDDPPTCGCIVGVRVDGVLSGECKTRVGSEGCPQGVW